jgi:hypothetical protein
VMAKKTGKKKSKKKKGVRSPANKTKMKKK